MLTDSQRLSIWQCYFEGVGRDETSNRTGINHAEVSMQRKVIEDTIGPNGVAVYNLARKLARERMGVADAEKGLEVEAILRKVGVSGPARIEKFANAIVDKAARAGTGGGVSRTPESVAENAIKLYEISESSRVPPERMVEELIRASSELQAKEAKLAEVNGKISQAEDELKLRLKENGVKESDLSEYVVLRDVLSRLKLDILDSSKVSRVFANAREANYNVEEIARRLSEVSSISGQLSKLAQDLKAFQEATKQLQVSKERLERENKENKAFYDEILVLKGIGFNREQLKLLKDKISGIAKQRGIGESQEKGIVNTFFEDLNAYDSLLGFKTQIELHRKELEQVNREFEEKKKQLGSLITATIALNELSSAGVSNKEIVAWHQILKNTGVGVLEFAEQLKGYAGVTALIDSKSGELAALNTRVSTSSSTLRELETNLDGVKTSIETIQRAAVDKINSVSGKATDKITEVNSEVTSQLGSLATATDDLTEQVTSALKEVQPVVTKFERVLEAGRAIGRAEYIAPALKILNGEKEGVQEKEARPSLLLFLERYLDWMQAHPSQTNRDLMPPVQDLISRLRVGQAT